MNAEQPGIFGWSGGRNKNLCLTTSLVKSCGIVPLPSDGPYSSQVEGMAGMEFPEDLGAEILLWGSVPILSVAGLVRAEQSPPCCGLLGTLAWLIAVLCSDAGQGARASRATGVGSSSC